MSFSLWRVVIFALISILLLGQSKVEAVEEPLLQGPVVMSQNGPQVTFQDVGSGRVWSREVGSSTRFESWSPDGCKLLFVTTSVRKPQWSLLSINDLELEVLASEIGGSIWYLDGESLTYVIYADDTNITSVYSFALKNQESSLHFESEGFVLPIQWLSEKELLYTQDGYRFVWNALTLEKRAFGTDIYPPYAVPEDVPSNVFYRVAHLLFNHRSPDQTLQIGFYDIDAYRSALDPKDHDLTDEYVQEIESQKPEITGFDLYALNEGTSRHVDVNGDFVESVSWSPSSEMIAVTTDYESEDYAIYIYDLETDTLERIADNYNDMAYYIYIPSWSPDEQWLAFRTQQGFVIYHLSDGERVMLDPELNGNQVHWSPVMDYSDVNCNG